MTKLSQILPNNSCIIIIMYKFYESCRPPNDRQFVLLHETLKCVYQKHFSLIKNSTKATFYVQGQCDFDL
jgi:hypothetical protein